MASLTNKVGQSWLHTSPNGDLFGNENQLSAVPSIRLVLSGASRYLAGSYTATATTSPTSWAWTLCYLLRTKALPSFLHLLFNVYQSSAPRESFVSLPHCTEQSLSQLSAVESTTTQALGYRASGGDWALPGNSDRQQDEDPCAQRH